MHTLSKSYDKLLKAFASRAYPGNGLLGKSNVDGLHSRCVAQLRAAAVGCWRAYYYTNRYVLGWADDHVVTSNVNIASHFQAAPLVRPVTPSARTLSRRPWPSPS